MSEQKIRESPFRAGQTVILIQAYGSRTPYEVIVSRVARKYVYVRVHGREVAFDKFSGFFNSGYHNADRIRTPEDWSDHKRRGELQALLRKQFGVSISSSHVVKSTAALEAVLTALVHHAGPSE